MKVFAIEAIAVEKPLALSDRMRNEPRDLYDFWYLFGSGNNRGAAMRAELDAKLVLRQPVIASMEQAIAAKEDRLRPHLQEPRRGSCRRDRVRGTLPSPLASQKN